MAYLRPILIGTAILLLVCLGIASFGQFDGMVRGVTTFTMLYAMFWYFSKRNYGDGVILTILMVMLQPFVFIPAVSDQATIMIIEIVAAMYLFYLAFKKGKKAHAK
ncbi:MAG TPA: hypothetical protein DCR21_02345 [Succinivibrionaceae bacterium]|nr:hypothetical protein [Succinivibrio sp.]HAR79648.1 hypothetical protein [Succinivibrionaceae bacterium]